ncbi:hypothetical protein [Alkalihalobacillus sp. AL-G]|uniref:hypothetical protein n=1 Tax=Alkalihalobacillus sp. AL-G TaxID=2926399 RepID=UPI00272A4BFB|nr:hypothetical protein [Alkalihalobacillus sp. AL-G]WLD92626.1 hypothetical protein MOJ78_16650 [Alkalihalobacillus sp. AL-G]
MTINLLPNFKIKHRGYISEQFIERGIGEFHLAATFVGTLPYGRNANRADYRLVLKEEQGTCSTKHALLSALCNEQGIADIKLVTGIYEMDKRNTPGIGQVLENHRLNAIPEAHCYLKYDNERFDFTRLDVKNEPIEVFLTEEEIQHDEIGHHKTQFHRLYLNKWIQDNRLEGRFDVDSLWKVREECIKALSTT